ncbi:DUF2461 domain-containing protein [Deminuibacter soli]|uniref:DUF2461 domain-containing protein n=1 Tax=Deminuibacter soli TaxID=2291815 RepID=A0A3E1NPT0_9BACT|nr:DUF2461 domain-containing protein [Deminuibacter soli]RFM29932.1 DUF2461 domain-containing protein [Deminuibacter soli]
MVQAATLQFLKNLAGNNHKDWFEANRSAYETARQDFATLVQEVIDRHGKKDADIASLTAKECIFRINRDVRFSKNKAPYKNNFGASIDRGGKKSIYAGYYIQLQPGDQSFLGGGLWMPEPENLKKIRQEIDYCADEFKGILHKKSFAGYYHDLEKSADTSLSRPPKGYDEENPAIDYIKLKSFIAIRSITDAEVLDKNFISHVLKGFEALHPLLQFLNRALE